MPAPSYDLQLISHNPLHARAAFPPNFPGFDGHFPDAPILPGFMHVQLALDALQLAGQPAQLFAVTNAKFLRGIPPEAPVEIRLLKNQDATWTVQLADPEANPYSHFTLATN